MSTPADMARDAVDRRAAFTPPAATKEERPLRVLIMTKIFPNRVSPGWAPFNRQQFAALSRLPGVQVVDVLATIPWFPGVGLLAGRSLAAGLVAVPAADEIDGLPVRHPRTLYLPRVGHALSGGLYTVSLLPHALRYRGRVDVVLGAWAYPDGCAAIALGRLLGAPVVVKAHGSDINVVGRMAGPRAIMRRVLPLADRLVAVSAALGREAERLGVPPGRIDVVRNGVDAGLFYPQDRAQARAQLGLPEAPTVVCVSRLEREKGVLDLLDAFAHVRAAQPGARLCLVGGGGAAAACAARAAAPDLRGAVHLPGPAPLREVPRWMAASDLVVMPSWAEGLPNTVLEAHACGRPVVATDVGGVGEVIDREPGREPGPESGRDPGREGPAGVARRPPELGLLVPPRQPEALGAAIVSALGRAWDPLRIAAQQISWERSAAALLCSLREAAGRGAAGA